MRRYLYRGVTMAGLMMVCTATGAIAYDALNENLLLGVIAGLGAYLSGVSLGIKASTQDSEMVENESEN